MQLFYDFLPIFVFFIVYKCYGIYSATASAMIISAAQLAFYYFTRKKFEKMQVITFLVIAVLGSATILLHNPLFIKWKPTVINGLFAIIFFGSHFFGQKPFVQYVMENKITLPKREWRRLNMSWITFFIVVGALNLYVAYHFSTEAWVNFKLFGLLGLTLLFAVLQAVYLGRVMDHSKSAIT